MEKLSSRSIRIISKYILRGQLHHDIHDEIIFFPREDIFAAYYEGPFSLGLSYHLILWVEAYDDISRTATLDPNRQCLRLMLGECGLDETGRFDLRKADKARMSEVIRNIYFREPLEHSLGDQEFNLYNTIINALSALVRFKEILTISYLKESTKGSSLTIDGKPALSLVH